MYGYTLDLNEFVERKYINGHQRKNSRQIFATNGNETLVFPSLISACEYFNSKPTTLSNAIRRETTHKGYKFSF